MLPFDSDNEGEQSFEEKATRNFSEEAIVPVTPPEVEAVAPTPAVGLGQFPEIPNYTFVRELSKDPVLPSYEVLSHDGEKTAVLHTFPMQQWANIEERVCFRRALEELEKIRHIHLAEILEVAESDGLPFLVVEQTPGETLDNLTKGRPFPTKFVANLGRLLAQTLGVIHHSGNRYGTLTPKHIRLHNTRELVQRQGQVAFGEPKIEGFHLSAVPKSPINPHDDSQTGHDFCYLAPEVVANPLNLSPESDIYSLGVILYELLTGRPPHLANTLAEIQELLQNRAIIKPSELVLGVNEALDHIVMRCLEKSPQRRYHKGEDLADDLLRYLKNEAVSVSKSSLWQTPVTPPHRSRFVWGVCLGLLISLGILAWGGFFFSEERLPEPINPELAKTIPTLSPDGIAPEKTKTPPEPKNLPLEHETITKRLIEHLNSEAEISFSRNEYESAATKYQRSLILSDSLTGENHQHEKDLLKAQTLLKLTVCLGRMRQYEKMDPFAKKSLQAWATVTESAASQKFDLPVLVTAFQNLMVVIPKDAETELYALSEKFEQVIRNSETTPIRHQSLSMLLRLRAVYFCPRDIELAEKAIRAVTLYANELLITDSSSLEANAFHQQALMLDAQLRLRIGDLEKAEERFNQILAPAQVKHTAIPIRIDALLGCAEIHYREKNIRSAEALLVSARTLGPCEKNINLMYGRLVVYYLNIDNGEQARNFAQKIVQSPERDRGLCVSVVRDFLRSFDYDTARTLTQLAVEQKVFEKGYFREFIEREPEYPTWAKNKDFRDWLSAE